MPRTSFANQHDYDKYHQQGRKRVRDDSRERIERENRERQRDDSRERERNRNRIRDSRDRRERARNTNFPFSSSSETEQERKDRLAEQERKDRLAKCKGEEDDKLRKFKKDDKDKDDKGGASNTRAPAHTPPASSPAATTTGGTSKSNGNGNGNGTQTDSSRKKPLTTALSNTYMYDQCSELDNNEVTQTMWDDFVDVSDDRSMINTVTPELVTSKLNKLLPLKHDQDPNLLQMPFKPLGIDTTLEAAGIEATAKIHISAEMSVPTSTVTVSNQPMISNAAPVIPSINIYNEPVNAPSAINNNTTYQPVTPLPVSTSNQGDTQAHAPSRQPGACPYTTCPGPTCGVCNGSPQRLGTGKDKFVANAKAVVYVGAIQRLRPIPPEHIANELAKIFTSGVMRSLAANPTGDFRIPEDLFRFLVVNHIASHSDASDQPVNIKKEIKQETHLPVNYNYDDRDNNDNNNSFSNSTNQQQRRFVNAGGSGYPFGDPSDDPDDQSGPRPHQGHPRRPRSHNNGEQRDQRGFGRSMGHGGPPPPPPGDSGGNDTGYDSEEPRERKQEGRRQRDETPDSSKRGTQERENEDKLNPLLNTPISRMTSSIVATDRVDPLSLILSGAASETAAKRLTTLERLSKRYNPETDPKKFYKKQTVSSVIDNIPEAPHQLCRIVKINELEGTTPLFFKELLRSGKHMASMDDFTPKLTFDPKARLRAFINANNDLSTDIDLDDDPETIQRHITLLLQLTIKTLTVPIDRVSARRNIQNIGCDSPETAIKTLERMMEQIAYVEDTVQNKEELLINEAKRAFAEYDERQRKLGKHSSLTEDIKKGCEKLASEYKGVGATYSGRELLLGAAQVLEQQNKELNITLGRGSLSTKAYGASDRQIGQGTLKLTDGKSNPSQWKSLSTFNPKSRGFREKLRKYKDKADIGLLGNSTRLLEDNDFISAIDELNKSQALEGFMENYYNDREDFNQEIDEDFIHAFAEYVLDGGPLAATNETSEGDIGKAKVLATLVQKSVQIRDDIANKAKAKEDEIKQKEANEKINHEQYRTQLFSGVIEQAKQTVREELANKSNRGYRYDEEDYEETEDVYNNSGPLQIDYPRTQDEVYVNQGYQGYKDTKHREMMGGIQQYNQPYNQRQNNPKQTYQNQISRPLNNNQPVSGVQTISKGNTPPEHCSTCGLHISECENITASTKDKDGNRQCSLRDNLKCQFGISIVALNKTKLLLLSKQQFEKVLNSASRYGCLQGSSREDIQEMKEQLFKDKENIIVQAQLHNQHEQQRSLTNGNSM